MQKDVRHLSTSTWVKIDDSIKAHTYKVLIPIGSLEQHGPHLPLSTDTIIADYIARQVGRRCVDTFLMPPLELGCACEHLGFSGTVSLQPETMSKIILDVSDSLLQSHFKEAYIINGHGGNKAPLDAAITKVKQALPEIRLYSFTIIDIVKGKFDEIRKSSRGLVGHADEIETSMMLVIQPNTVDMSKAIREEPSLPRGLSFEKEDLARISFGWTAKELTKTGVMGDPQVANAETGKVLLDYVIESISNSINEL